MNGAQEVSVVRSLYHLYFNFLMRFFLVIVLMFLCFEVKFAAYGLNFIIWIVTIISGDTRNCSV